MTTPGHSHRNALKSGYQLHWYVIREILGQGGFGITYLAQDTNLNQPVAIKEYVPVELAVREDAVSIHPVSGDKNEEYQWGLERFINEAQTLARFRHPNIIRVLAVFKENNTAYMVMEYEQGRPLHEILKDRKTLPEAELKNILLPILDGLAEVHAENFIHRDIKPANIYLRADQSPVLLDFGSARQALGAHTRTLTTLISPGYAPFEQYTSNSRNQGPWTDIYGLGATMYRAVTGLAPPDSMNRSEALLHTGRDIFVPAAEIAAGRYSPSFLAAIDHAMTFKGEDRPRGIAAWLDEMEAAPTQILSADNHAEDVTAPSLSTGSDADQQPQPALKIEPAAERTLRQPRATPEPSPAQGLDRMYGLVKKMFKGLVLVFIVLAATLVFMQHRSRDITQTGGTQPQREEAGSPAVETGLPAEIERLLAAAGEDFAANRLTLPVGNNAVEKYRKVLELDPGNVQALRGLDAVVDRYLQRMDQALGRNDPGGAQGYFDKALAINPLHPGIESARSRLEAARAQATAPAPPPAGTSATTTTTAPETYHMPGSDREGIQALKERLRANPDDKAARQELKELSKRYERNIRAAMDNGDYALARDYVQEVQSMTTPGSKSWGKLNDLLRDIDKEESRARR